jgi:hypothetical protein
MNQETLDQYDYYDDEFIEIKRKFLAPRIGNFIISFSLLEQELNTTISELIFEDTHLPGYLIINKTEIMDKALTMINLFNSQLIAIDEEYKDEMKTKIQKLKTDLVKIIEFRNKIAHANWSTLKEGYVVRTKFKYDSNTINIVFNDEKLCLKTIDKKEKAIHQCIKNILLINEKFNSLIYNQFENE